MRLASADPGYSQLFLAVLPTIVKALPPRPVQNSSSTIAKSCSHVQNDEIVLKNSIHLLRFEIQEMQKVLTKDMSEYDLSDEAHGEASSALEDVLSLFEERVDGMILKNVLWSRGHDSLPILDQKFPKLTSLRNHIQCHNLSSTLHPPSHSLLDTLKLISFGEKASDFRRRASEAQQFNNIMRGIFDSLEVDMESQMTQVFQHGDSQNDEEIANEDIYQAQRLCNTTKVLFETMADISKSCRSHSAFIHLSGFRKPEIGMVMSICGGKDKKQWHQVYWTNEPLSTEFTSSQLGSVCFELKQSRKFKNPLCVHLQRDGSWKYAKQTANRMMTHSVAPVLTLEELLRTNQEKAKAAAPSTKLLKKDKLDLAVEIARSLLYLFGSPLLQETWKPENIHVSRTLDGSTGDRLQIKSYIYRDLNYNFLNFEGESKHVPTGHSYILYLGTLLWELFFERKLNKIPEDEEDEEEEEAEDLSLYNALNREENNLRQCFVEVPFLDIISNCLTLYSQTELDGLELRRTIYWNIVNPLKALHSYYAPSEEKSTPIGSIHSFANKSSSSVRGSLHVKKGLYRSIGEHSIAKRAMNLVQKFTSNSSLQLVSPNSELLASTGIITNSTLWLSKFDAINHRLKVLTKVAVRPVKVAVLDTGCDLSAQCFNSSGIRQDERLAGHWFDCLNEDDEPVDKDSHRHGTAITTLLLRLLPTADIYIARVARDADDLSRARENVAKAITHAAQIWNVDIVSMSFGFSDEVSSIESAIATAEKLRQRRIVFFAAANNDGLNEKEMFPAGSESVISVRGTGHDGSFIQQFNPETWPHKSGMKLFGTISQNVPCDWTSGRLVKSGCSVATPIVAAIAAMIIWFVSMKKASSIGFEDMDELIRTRRGILSVFGVMTQDQNQCSTNHRYLAPWQLFGDNNSNDVKEEALIKFALSKLPSKG